MSEPIKHEINLIEQDADFSRLDLIAPGLQLCTCFRCSAAILVRAGLDMRPMHLRWHHEQAEQIASLHRKLWDIVLIAVEDQDQQTQFYPPEVP